MTSPAPLKIGDTVLIIATARKTTPELMRPAIELLEKYGLKVELGKNLYKEQDQFAGNDKERAKDLQWAIDHKKAKAVIIAGGGYGTVRIIDQVNFIPLAKYPKWFAGFSDATVIHSRLHNMKIASLHSTMAFRFSLNADATRSLLELLFGERAVYDIPPNALNKKGECEGEICGGNLSLLYSLSGSKDDIHTKNKILFIEDLDEYLYHIDRMMIQLKRSGKLKDLKGLIVGGMTEMKDNSVPFGKKVEEIILDAVKEYKYPVCFGFPAGHIEDNRALYLGKKAKLSVGKNEVNLTYSEK
jgi:muramoyltetrapeptide carboxypeptidase